MAWTYLMERRMDDWKPLPEDPEERAQFERGVKHCGDGDARHHIATALRIWAAVSPGGSYAAQCHIMANEVMKLQPPAQRELSEDEAAAVKFYAENPRAALQDFGRRTRGVGGNDAQR
jgi:hypothetical protein